MGSLLDGSTAAGAVLILSLVAAAGLALGSLKIRSLGLGIPGVLFAGIAFGHFGVTIGESTREWRSGGATAWGGPRGGAACALVGSARRSAPRADPGDVPRYDLGAGRRQELAARPPAPARLDWRTALVLLTLLPSCLEDAAR